VIFADGTRVPLPTDQIVLSDDSGEAARVGFGGMSFEGMDADHLVLYRVRDLQPEELLSPQRGRTMTLEPQMVSSGQHARPFGRIDQKIPGSRDWLAGAESL
jgi:hypothetical protein